MKGAKIYRYIYLGAAVLMPLYLVVAAVHLFFATKSQTELTRLVNSFVKTDIQVTYFRSNAVRTIYGKSFNAQQRDTAPVLIFSKFPSKTATPGRYHIVPVHRHVWLTKPVFRI